MGPMDATRFATRMDRVQAPIIPVVGGWIRETPGTISLGQGVVHYGPPPETLDAVRDSLAQPATHEYNDGAGIPPLVAAIAQKLAVENHIDVGRGSRIMVTAGANMAFMHVALAITSPGDEIILPVPFYFNHEMAIEMAGCRAVRVPTDDRYQLRARRHRARDHRSDACDRHHLTEQSEWRGPQRGVARRRQRSLSIARVVSRGR